MSSDEALELSGEKRLTVFGLLIGCALISLDPNLVGIVTPELATDLKATSLYGWIAGAYLIALTVSVPIVGKAVEVYSVRKIYLGSMIVFLIGTALCAIAPEVHSFLAFRVVQGLGAGGIFSTNFAVAAVLFSPRAQGVILSYFNVASGLAMVAGAVVGGMLADYTTWRDTLDDSVAPGEGADGNNNGVIDQGDYELWRQNYGLSAAAVGASAAPEPAAVGLVLSALAAVGGLRAARQRR